MTEQPVGAPTRQDKSAGRRLYATERQERILARARAEGRVDVARVAEELQVTPETIRKDLDLLEQAGFVRRVHGGAFPVERGALEKSITDRIDHAGEKLAIARRALDEVPDSGSIFIEAGSTTQRLAEILPDNRSLVVITNSLPAAVLLAARPGGTVITLGGRVRDVTLGEVGPFALRSLKELAVDVAFLGANGISVHRGLTTPDSAEADVKRAIIAAASRRVLLADSSKIGTVALWRYGSVSDVQVLITDGNADPADVAQLRAAGPDVFVAG